MASNANNTSTCPLTGYWLWFGQELEIASATVITPMYFFFGVSGRLVSLLALHQERKSEKAYLYQTLVLVSELLEIISFTATKFLWNWAAFLAQQRGPLWFSKCYFCMWYTAHICSVVDK